MSTNDPLPGSSWLEERLGRLDANYRRFGRESLKDFPLADVQLLLSSKRLALDAMKGRSLTEAESKGRSLLTLEVQDISGWVRGQVAFLERPPEPWARAARTAAAPAAKTHGKGF